MRIAVLADIHANLEALRATTSAIEDFGAEQVYVLGDVVGYGPDPSACIAWIRARGWPCVGGNWDWVVGRRTGYDPGPFNPTATASLWWTRGATSDDERAWLASLPVELVADGLHLVHGRPAAGDDRVTHYLLEVAQARDAFACARAEVACIGHTHRAIAWLDEDPIAYVCEGGLPWPPPTRLIINAGSVGQPRDGDARACWLAIDTEAGSIGWQRTEYDVEATLAKVDHHGLPGRLRERLTSGM